MPRPLLSPQAQAAKIKIAELRNQLLDLSNRNRLLNFKHTARGARQVRIVDESLNELFAQLQRPGTVELVELPDLPGEPDDENDQEFINAFEESLLTDKTYLRAAAKIEAEPADDADAKLRKAERALRDRVRRKLNRSPRHELGISLDAHAAKFGINPAYHLEGAQQRRRPLRHWQTLLSDEELARRLRAIVHLGKGLTSLQQLLLVKVEKKRGQHRSHRVEEGYIARDFARQDFQATLTHTAGCPLARKFTRVVTGVSSEEIDDTPGALPVPVRQPFKMRARLEAIVPTGDGVIVRYRSAVRVRVAHGRGSVEFAKRVNRGARFGAVGIGLTEGPGSPVRERTDRMQERRFSPAAHTAGDKDDRGIPDLVTPTKKRPNGPPSNRMLARCAFHRPSSSSTFIVTIT
ncbi:MAG: DUF4011 domain-containing protein [Verrucomicrobia bacterium]|nr:DUF4011 domain-containing protein [Verrucomicrobiota bacterium]